MCTQRTRPHKASVPTAIAEGWTGQNVVKAVDSSCPATYMLNGLELRMPKLLAENPSADTIAFLAVVEKPASK